MRSDLASQSVLVLPNYNFPGSFSAKKYTLSLHRVWKINHLLAISVPVWVFWLVWTSPASFDQIESQIPKWIGLQKMCASLLVCFVQGLCINSWPRPEDYDNMQILQGRILK